MGPGYGFPGDEHVLLVIDDFVRALDDRFQTFAKYIPLSQLISLKFSFPKNMSDWCSRENS